MTRRETQGTLFVCRECGHQSLKWEGRCPSCGQWDALEQSSSLPSRSPRGTWLSAQEAQVRELTSITPQEVPRLPLPFSEVNRVLGGGLVPGSVVLIAGEPGIGKSTLLLQMAQAVAQTHGKALYVSGEESAQQLRLRSQRLEISGEGVLVLCETDVETVLTHLDQTRPSLMVVDSIQTMHWGGLDTHPGSVAQIRECTRLLMQQAKVLQVPLLLAGHVTKEGDIAGPRMLEHMVDVVLSLEGERVTALRLLRGVKNRFGSTNEVGVFQMESQGLVEVADPSRVFVEERLPDAVGSILVPTLEGTRPLLVEVQALTTPSAAPVPRRIANGVEFSRLLLIASVLSQRLDLSLGSQDIIVSIAGGLRVAEPAADLGIALAIASSLRNTPIEANVAAVGEVGLSGEVRRVPQLERRLGELSRLGMERCLVPPTALDALPSDVAIEAVPVRHLRQALEVALPRLRRGEQVTTPLRQDPLDLAEE